MVLKRKLTVAITAAACVLGLAAAPAFAAMAQNGYIECNSGRSVSISSRTHGPSGYKNVTHSIPGGSVVSFGQYGYNHSRHSIAGGTWSVSTTGFIDSAGGACAG